MEDAFAAGEKAKEADAVAAYYADDAISYSRNKPPASGKAAIKEQIAQQLAKEVPAIPMSMKLLIFLAKEIP